MQIPGGPAPVVVAVHGTAAGLAATRLGAREAKSRGLPLRVLHAFAWPGPYPCDDPPDYAAARHDAAQMVKEAVETAARTVPGVRVSGRVEEGDPARILLRASRTAALLVLGDDGLAVTPRPAPSTVLVQTVTHARCPVVVARGVRPPGGPVVAAVDGSPWSIAALRMAVDEARRRDLALLVTHVIGDETRERDGLRVLERAVASVPEHTRTRTRLLVGEAGPSLVRASRTARVLIAGARGTEGFSALGAVASQLLRRCACPTVFVHGTPADDGPPDGTVPSSGAVKG
jgi:nucleotide-binding universal stress UspA family protein